MTHSTKKSTKESTYKCLISLRNKTGSWWIFAYSTHASFESSLMSILKFYLKAGAMRHLWVMMNLSDKDNNRKYQFSCNSYLSFKSLISWPFGIRLRSYFVNDLCETRTFQLKLSVKDSIMTHRLWTFFFFNFFNIKIKSYA